MCITNMPPPVYGAPSPIAMPQQPQPLVYPTPNSQPGGVPAVRASISASFARTATFPLRGWVTGSVTTRQIAPGRHETWFVISYSVHVRNSRGGETPLEGSEWVIRMVSIGRMSCFSRHRG